MLMDRKNQYSENEHNTQSNLQIKCNPYQATNGIFFRALEQVISEFTFWGSKITADGDCSHEIKRLFGRKVMTNLDSILKSKDITLPTKVHLVKAVVFPVVMYGCESWTVKKDEH